MNTNLCGTDPIVKSIEDLKSEIDKMGHYELCSKWRFAPSGDPLLQGEVGIYFKDRLFKHLGGFIPSISKSLGWGE